MIQSFKDASTAKLFLHRESKKWAGIAKIALRKLDHLHFAADLKDLRIPPANHLERLKGDRKGQHSIRINDQFRVCFVWRRDGAYDVEITDYH